MKRSVRSSWMIAIWLTAFIFAQSSVLANESETDNDFFNCVGSLGGGKIQYCFEYRDTLFVFHSFAVRAIDIKDPEHPRLGGVIRTNDEIKFIGFYPPALYLQCFLDPLVVVDLSDSNEPRVRNRISGGGGTPDLELMGSYLYQSNNDKHGRWFSVYDISKPFDPREVAEGDPRYPKNGGFVTDGKRIFIVSDTVRDRDGTCRSNVIDGNTSQTLGSFTIRDFEDPYHFGIRNGSLVVFVTDSTQGFVLADNIYSDEIWSNVDPNPKVKEKVVRLEDEKPDIFKRAQKALSERARKALDTYQNSTQYIESLRDFKIAGGIGFIADQNGDLVIADFKNAAAPNFLARLHGLALAHVYAVQNEMVYAGNSADTLFAIDCSRPTSPTLASCYNGPLGPIAVSGNKLYIIEENEGFQILDGAKRGKIGKTGGYKIRGITFTDLAASGSLIYLTAEPPDNDQQDELFIVDVVRPSEPKLISRIPIFTGKEKEYFSDEGKMSLKKMGNIVYAIRVSRFSGACESHCKVIDVANPAAPRVVGSVSTEDQLNKEDVSKINRPKDSSARWHLGLPAGFHNTFESGSMMFFYDLSDPVHPKYAGQYRQIYGNETPVLDRGLIAINNSGELILLDPK